MLRLNIFLSQFSNNRVSFIGPHNVIEIVFWY